MGGRGVQRKFEIISFQKKIPTKNFWDFLLNLFTRKWNRREKKTREENFKSYLLMLFVNV